MYRVNPKPQGISCTEREIDRLGPSFEREPGISYLEIGRGGVRER
jgi:hypothetical protein